jgi:hypothetical protein
MEVEMTKLKTVFPAVLLFIFVGAIPPTDAKAQGDGLPTIDIEKNCRSRTTAAVADSDRESSVGSCVASEKKAQAALVAAWKDIPPRYKTTCIKPGDYSPSYIEWIACLELYIDVKNLPAEVKNVR